MPAKQFGTPPTYTSSSAAYKQQQQQQYEQSHPGRILVPPSNLVIPTVESPNLGGTPPTSFTGALPNTPPARGGRQNQSVSAAAARSPQRQQQQQQQQNRYQKNQPVSAMKGSRGHRSSDADAAAGGGGGGGRQPQRQQHTVSIPQQNSPKGGAARGGGGSYFSGASPGSDQGSATLPDYDGGFSSFNNPPATVDEDITRDETAGADEEASADDSLSEASGHTGSTGTSRTAESLKSQLPCGLTLTMVMLILIMIPVIFLVVYTAIPLATASQARNYLLDHKDVIHVIFDIAENLEEERSASSLFLGNTAGSATANAAMAELNTHRPLIDYDIRKALHAMAESDSSEADAVSLELQLLATTVTELRTKVDGRTINGPTARNRFLDLSGRAYLLTMWLMRDDRAESIARLFFQFMIIRRVENSVQHMRAVAIGLFVNEGHDSLNLAEMHAMLENTNRDFYLVNQSSTGNLKYAAKEGAEHMEVFAGLTNSMLHTPKASWGTVPGLNMVNYLAVCDTFLEFFETLDVLVVNDLLAGEGLLAKQNEEIGKMIGGIAACVIAVFIVVYLSGKEQERLEKTLENSNFLADAVQHFVPRNQLKTMGVRSILQVHPGLQVEVAQTMLFAGIKDFVALSEQMTRLELFDWLAAYSARMSTVTGSHKGYIDKFIGDALFCVFPQPTNGVEAAIEMQVASEQLNVDLIAHKNQHELKIGIGLHFGVVVAGVFGDETRLTCTLIASDVNLASRLEGLTKPFGCKIIASEPLVAQLNQEMYNIRSLGKVQVSGSGKGMPIYDIFQTDMLKLKKFKEATVAKFMEAADISETDHAAAQLLFSEMIDQAHNEFGVRDIPSEVRKSAPAACRGVLGFTKGGELKSPSETSAVQYFQNGMAVTPSSTPVTTSVTAAVVAAAAGLGSFHLNEHERPDVSNKNKKHQEQQQQQYQLDDGVDPTRKILNMSSTLPGEQPPPEEGGANGLERRGTGLTTTPGYDDSDVVQAQAPTAGGHATPLGGKAHHDPSSHPQHPPEHMTAARMALHSEYAHDYDEKDGHLLPKKNPHVVVKPVPDLVVQDSNDNNDSKPSGGSGGSKQVVYSIDDDESEKLPHHTAS